ncbi:MAG: polyphosphate:AMP phosphotransferase [Negativicutes bacterium]|nr:polyphosphate:AMP phosphotransferase [Negativicutes bacterium]
MLETIDLTGNLAHPEYEKLMLPKVKQLGALQRQAHEAGCGIAVIIEGWHASGKGIILNFFNQTLDPRGFRIYTDDELSIAEKERPYLWPFWTNTPAKGQIVVFDSTWYRRIVTKTAKGKVSASELRDLYRDVLRFEQALTDDGFVVIKLFLHISEKEQKQRLKALEHEDYEAWRVTKKAWKQNSRYDHFLRIYETLLTGSHTAAAPWTIIPAHDKHLARVEVADAMIKAISAILDPPEPGDDAAAESPLLTAVSGRRASPVPTVAEQEEADYHRELAAQQQKLRALQFDTYRLGIPIIIAFEGWDAAGKGGTIHRLCHQLDPRGYRVVPVSAPNDSEKQHHYLWRFWREFPADGEMVIFDRSWYGRVLVERVEDFATRREWERAYGEISAMEQHLAGHGAIILKFWLDITPEEQLKRFRERETDPDKRWKITEEDWRNRAKRDAYEPAVADMLVRTHHSYAPWHIIDANQKQSARLTVLSTVIQALEARCSEK